jgi:hypothetical protein
MSAPIVETPEAITPAWITEALAAGGHLAGAVAAIELTPVGTGQMCDSVRVAITYDDADAAAGSPATLVAKLPAADETSRATALALRSYENEVRFYQQLAPALPMRTPAVYFADIDVTTAAFTLLLEDMAPARQGDQLTGCTPDEAAVAVAELVKLHAPRWGDPSLADLEWLHRDPANNKAFMTMLLPNLWDGFRERYADQLGADVHEAGAALFADLGAYLTADNEPHTIVHGDYRLDNLLFDPTPGGTPIAVVDWQTCTHNQGLADVAYFIGAGLQLEDRQKVEDALVREYHAGLVAAGVSGYDWDRCWRDYRRGTFTGLIMAIAASMLVERTDRGDEMFMAMASRHARHALDLEAAAVIR